MSSHRDFTPDEDEDELLLPTPRQQPDSPRHGRSQERRRLSATAAAFQSVHPPAVTSIRLKIGGGESAKGPGRYSSTSTTEPTAPPLRNQEDDDNDNEQASAQVLQEGLPSPNAGPPLPLAVRGKQPRGLSVSKPASSSDSLRPSSSSGSRKRVLSNPSEPVADESDVQRSDAVATLTPGGGRKRAKLSASSGTGTGTGKKSSSKRGSKLAALAMDPHQRTPRTDYGSLTPPGHPQPLDHEHGTEGDALLADEISLMAAAEQGAKRSIKGSSPVRPAAAEEGYDTITRGFGGGPSAAKIGSPGYISPLAALVAAAERDEQGMDALPLQDQPPLHAVMNQKRRATPESSPEIELVSATYNQRPVVVSTASTVMPSVPPMVAPRKKKAWLKSAKLIPIAPNLGSSSSAAAAAAAFASTSALAGAGGAGNFIPGGDPLAFTPPPANFYTAVLDKRTKTSKKSRAAAAAAQAAAAQQQMMMSSPNPDSMDGEGMLYSGLEQRVTPFGLRRDAEADGMALDMALLGEGEEIKPKKKKSKKLKVGEVGPGKHWRKGVLGPHVARFPGDGGGDLTSELGGDSPNSMAAGSSHVGRLLLPKPARGEKRRRKSLHPRGGEDELMPYHIQAAGTPDEYVDDFEHAANASTRSSPEISMRNDPTIGLSRSGMPHPAAVVYKPKPLIEGVDGECIVPKHPAELEKLGHPVYRNSILTRGISIIRIQDFSGGKAKERELMVPRSLKDNLGPQPRQFDEGYRVITGVGGARLRLRSWIPRTSPSEYRIQRDAKIEEIRLAEAATSVNQNAEMPARPALFSSASQRNLSLDGKTPETWLSGNQAQIHPGQQVRKYSAFVQAGPGDAGATPPKKPAKKKKKKKVVKSAEELVPEMPSPQLGSRIPSAAVTPDVMLNDPMEGVSVADDEQLAIDQSPYVDDLIMDAV
ncbi:hypothetical protein QFC21_001787 [Naganishia friedmannii]|uniref:Uncharacterized protein n=1 Tax=Naganishia friedmannii TaxID=89922 RepID=A0ACC2W3H7_9TREE|nr:hypothetical protein QFC21_001787 [Naganishia friedmannii]